MSVRRLGPEQPEQFGFSPENLRWAKARMKNYPKGKQASAVIPLLWRAQEQHGGWLPEPAIRCVGDLLDMAFIRVYEVATFYTMFNLAPVGKYYVQLCGTTPCWLSGAEDLKAVCRQVIGNPGRVTGDGLFSWLEVECLGACANAPMVQINKDYYEDLTGESFRALLEDLRAGKEVAPGPKNGRTNSCPLGGRTSLLDLVTGGSPEPGEPEATDDHKPDGLETAREGGANDLRRISGIGPKIENTLNELGIFHFDQIATWTEENVAWVNSFLSFRGRVERENWIRQAEQFAAEGDG